MNPPNVVRVSARRAWAGRLAPTAGPQQFHRGD